MLLFDLVLFVESQLRRCLLKGEVWYSIPAATYIEEPLCRWIHQALEYRGAPHVKIDLWFSIWAALSRDILIMWCRFYYWLRDPNVDDRQNRADQRWPEYSVDDRQVIVLDLGDQLETQTGLRDRQCHFWSEFVPRLRAASAAGTVFSRYLSFHI